MAAFFSFKMFLAFQQAYVDLVDLSIYLKCKNVRNFYFVLRLYQTIFSSHISMRAILFFKKCIICHLPILRLVFFFLILFFTIFIWFDIPFLSHRTMN